MFDEQMLKTLELFVVLFIKIIYREKGIDILVLVYIYG